MSAKAIRFESSGLSLGGLVPLSTTDYPGCLSAVLFCRGCPWRCRYCHNTHLQSFGATDIALDDIARFLSARRGLLDAVVFSGGEPSFQKGLKTAAAAVKELGFKVGMHTAAPSLKHLQEVIPLLDWVGLDIKANIDDYESSTGIENSGEEAFAALDLLLLAGLALEVRTTVHSLLLSRDQLLRLANTLASKGVRNYAVQMFRSKGCKDQELNRSVSFLDQALIAELDLMFERFTLRTS